MSSFGYSLLLIDSFGLFDLFFDLSLNCARYRLLRSKGTFAKTTI